jgi:hypothetical protein
LVFRKAQDFLDEDWKPSEMKIETPESFISYQLPVIPGIMNTVHSMLILYILWRLHMLPLGLAAEALDRVHAKKTDDPCDLPVDLYAILYIIISLQVTSLAPCILSKAFSLLKEVWNKHVEAAAIKRLRNEQTPDEKLV